MEFKAGSLLHRIDRECRRWELQQREHAAMSRPKYWPVITVSRQFGARGEMLARRIGAEIGFPVWDGELVHAVAEETGANERILRSLDERRRRVIEDSIEGAFMGRNYMNSDYMRRLMRLIHSLGSHGSTIIVGRGAEFILDSGSALRVRVVCPFETRVWLYGERHELDATKARREIERGERERDAFVRQNFGRRASDGSDYDLIVNSGTLPMEKLVDVVLGAYAAKFEKRPPHDEAPTLQSQSA